MALVSPFDIYGTLLPHRKTGSTNLLFAVSKPSALDFTNVRTCLLNIINICLEADPSLVPASASSDTVALGNNSSNVGNSEDSDDFRFWSEKQAKRIATCIHEAFGVEYASSVILADANVTTLTNRILATKELLE